MNAPAFAGISIGAFFLALVLGSFGWLAVGIAFLVISMIVQ